MIHSCVPSLRSQKAFSANVVVGYEQELGIKSDFGDCPQIKCSVACGVSQRVVERGVTNPCEFDIFGVSGENGFGMLLCVHFPRGGHSCSGGGQYRARGEAGARARHSLPGERGARNLHRASAAQL